MEGKIAKKKVYPPLCHKVKETPPMEETTIKGADIAKPFYHFSPLAFKGSLFNKNGIFITSDGVILTF